jgi:hypothetical protein
MTGSKPLPKELRLGNAGRPTTRPADSLRLDAIVQPPRRPHKKPFTQTPKPTKTGYVSISVTLPPGELVWINARAQSLGISRAFYFRTLANQDRLSNGPLAIHVLRHELLKDTEAALLALRAEQLSAGQSAAGQPAQATPGHPEPAPSATVQAASDATPLSARLARRSRALQPATQSAAPLSTAPDSV